MSAGSKQVIGQGELLPVVISKILWHQLLKGRRNLFFLDNESARHANIRGYSPVRFSREILSHGIVQDAKLLAFNWYARVPTGSNVADGPSRGDYSEMEKLGAIFEDCTGAIPQVHELVAFDVVLAMGALPLG